MKHKLADHGHKPRRGSWTKYKAIKAVEAGKKKNIEIATEFSVKSNTLFCIMFIPLS